MKLLYTECLARSSLFLGHHRNWHTFQICARFLIRAINASWGTAVWQVWRSSRSRRAKNAPSSPAEAGSMASQHLQNPDRVIPPLHLNLCPTFSEKRKAKKEHAIIRIRRLSSRWSQPRFTKQRQNKKRKTGLQVPDRLQRGGATTTFMTRRCDI